jgi:hypothetical protein
MIPRDLLQNPPVRNWLGGIEPAWTLLDLASFNALRRPPSPTAGPIRLAADLADGEIQQSAVARNALILLRAAAGGPGLKMTATGNLSRGVVAEMCDLFTWPGFDKTEAFRLHKVINEPDFLPLFFVRHVVEAGKLLRRHKGHLKITPTGRQMLEERTQGALQAVLFHLALWRLDLGYLGRSLHHGWPQRDIGFVLWSLSIAANDWQPPDRLTRLCTIPIDETLQATWDTASHAMEATILRPLLWFGLLEYREDDKDGDRWNRKHFYRKTPLFKRFLSFDIKLEAAAGPRH